jgi:subtilisin-like proprotein convertase family protein
MTTLSRRTRLLAAPVALALAAGTLGALAAPASAAKSTFTQDADVFIGDSDHNVSNGPSITINNVGAATPYPSEIVIPHGAEILDLDVRLFDVSHTLPDEIEVLLVGPGGQQVLLWSDAGGSTDIVNQDITFNDEDGDALPDEAAITLSSYHPTNYGVGDAMPAPAPAVDHNTSLSVFDGLSAAGTWKLFVEDETVGDSGSIAGGWGLGFELATSPYPSTLAVSGVGTVSDVNVTLSGIDATYPDDTDILLVGPGGQQATLMSDVGGSNDLAAVTLTLDDEAAESLPDNGQIVSGAFKPTNVDDGADSYGPPAPVTTGATLLSAFDGVGGNGEWRLFAVDDISGFLMSLTAWSLDITWTDNQAPTGSVSVNAGAAASTSKNVTLNLSAADPAPATGVAQMRFSNDGVTFSAYQPYATTAAWTLTGADGTKTVYAQFKDGEGNQSAVVTDAIKLDVLGPKAKKVTPKKNAKGVKATTKVKIKASEALKKKSVNKKTVFLKEKGVSGKIKAKVKYNAAKKLIVLTPVDALDGNTTYKVTVKNVRDAFGHKWDEKPKKAGAQPLKYSFKTA